MTVRSGAKSGRLRVQHGPTGRASGETRWHVGSSPMRHRRLGWLPGYPCRTAPDSVELPVTTAKEVQTQMGTVLP
jgi:hypothetical protein